MPVEVKLRKGEAMEKALRRLKKKLDREGVSAISARKETLKSRAKSSAARRRWPLSTICSASVTKTANSFYSKTGLSSPVFFIF